MKGAGRIYLLAAIIVACVAVAVWRLKPRPSEEVRGLPPPTEIETVKAVAARVLDTDSAVAWQAVTDIGRMEARSEAPRLVAALNDSRPEVREAAATSLGWVAVWETIPELLDAMEDRDPMVRRAAHHAVVRMTGKDYGFPADGPPEARRMGIQRFRAKYAENYPGYLDWMRRKGVEVAKEGGP